MRKLVRGFFPLVVLGSFSFYTFVAHAEDNLPAEAMLSAPPVLVLSLEKSLELALENYPKLRGANAGVDAARFQREEANALFWPRLEYKYRAAPVPSDVSNAVGSFFDGNITLFNSFHLALTVPLTTFGQLKITQDLADGGIEAAKYYKQKEELDVLYEVKRIYYGLQFAAEVKHIINDAIKKVQNKIDDEEEKDTPDIEPTDLIKLKLFKVELEKRLRETEENEVLAQDGLRFYLQLPDEQAFHLSKLSLDPTRAKLDAFEEYIENSLDTQLDAKLLTLGVESKKRQLKLEKYKRLPKAGVGAFYDVGGTTSSISGLANTDDFSDPFNYQRAGFGFQLSGDLDLHGSHTKIKKAEAEVLKASFDQRAAKKGLELKARKSFYTAKRLKENYLAADRARSLARQAVFLEKSNQDIGVGEADKYAEVLQTLLLKRGEYFKSVYDYNLALADLERTVAVSLKQIQQGER